MESGPNQDERGALICGAIRVASLGLGFLTTLLLARWMGVDGFGAYSYVIGCIAIWTVLGIAGIDRLLVRNLAAYAVEGRPNLIAAHLRWALSTSICLAACLGLAGAELLAGRPSPPTVAIGAVIAFTVLITVLQAGIRGLGDNVGSHLPGYLIVPAVEIAGVALIARAGGWRIDVAQVLTVYAIAAVIGCVFAAGRLKRSLPDVAPSREAVEGLAAEWRRDAFVLLMVIGGGMVLDQVDVVALGILRGVHDVGLYSAADKGASLVAFPLNAAQLALGPVFARLWASGDRMGLESVARRGGRAALAASLAIAVGLLAGPWFLALFGVAFRGSLSILAILTAGQLVNAATGPVGALLVMTKNEGTVGRITAAAFVVDLLLTIAFIHAWGAVGAAAATALVTAGRNVAFAAGVRRRLGIDGTAIRLGR